MRAFITGGAGFIGSHLSEYLLAQGHEVSIIDDLSTGAIDNVKHLRANPKFTHVTDSIFNEPLMAELIDEADVVYHLAAAVGVRLIVEAPIRTIETNLKGAEIILRHASKKHKPVLLASTSEVYGKSTKIPFCEDDDSVLGPTTKSRWSYACSKLIDEFLALSYWRERKLPIVIARLFNCVGPRQTGRYGMVVPRFVGQAVRGETITVYGDGTQSRCFGYVGDTIRAMTALLGEPRAYGEIYNVGSDEEVTIMQLAERVRARVNPAVKIDVIPYDKAYEPGFEDMHRRVPCLDKVRALIDYRPTVKLDEIIDRVAAHMRATGAGA